MERALDFEHLRIALGEGGALPSAEVLQARLAEAEIALFLGAGHIDDELLATAWYLHAVGSARASLELYSVDRQRRANQVSAHIFDLALESGERHRAERREMIFAAQIGSLRGGLDPNSRALYQHRPQVDPHLRESCGEAALDVGSALLALDRARLFSRLEELRTEADRLRAAVDVGDLIDTPYGAASRVVEGCFELLVHLTYNRPDRLARATRLFTEAIHAQYSHADLDSRWVAAHLLDIADHLGTSSVWAQLPSSVPPSAARAMTLGEPAVLSLWPPQFELLATRPSPLDPNVRRLLLSFPTSGGKTLIAQYLIAAHIASGAGGACVVVPTHSLGREVQRDLDRRLNILGLDATDAGPVGLPIPNGPQAVVMTPEKFAAHLRTEPQRMLADFSLFVVDEAHMVGDNERGWTFESALSFLHTATAATHHRIVLLSAALGNRIHIATWLATDGRPAFTFHHDWRGPRRAHALFGTRADWDAATEQPPKKRGGLTRQNVPLYGTVHVRTATDRHHSLRTTHSIGSLIRKRRGQGLWTRDANQSDPQYKIRARMATILGAHGSVLIVEPTKQAAQRMALAVAAELDSPAVDSGSLVALATLRLGPTHPLIEPLRQGVGFHHAALPADIQAELEDALRRGTLRYLVATTTLIEGINFPVRSVLIGERGYHASEGYVTTLDGPRLLNAIGRAGRAGRETEGWVVLALTEEFSEASFASFTVSDGALTAVSRLSRAEALAALATFEASVLQREDAIMETAGNAVADFISHVWFVANSLEDLRLSLNDSATTAIESTLAWQQLDEVQRNRWKNVAALALDVYARTPAVQRRRWARAGTSLSTASTLERLAADIRRELPTVTHRSNPVEAFTLVSSGTRLEQLLQLSEARFRSFRPHRNAPVQRSLQVDLRALISDWLTGRDFSELGQAYLGDVDDETYRYEQLSEFVSTALEHFLPWLLSTILPWVNDDLPPPEHLCSELPAYLRYGVDTPIALELARGGIRSRRLVHVIAAAARAASLPVRPWLAAMDARRWRTTFAASPSEVADLLFFTRAQDIRITSRVLGGDSVEFQIAVDSPSPAGVVTLLAVDDSTRIEVARAGEHVGYIPASHHDDVSRLLCIGIPLTVRLTEEGSIVARIDDPTARPAWFSSSPS